MNEAREPISFRLRVVSRNPAHVRATVFAGRGDGHRACAGELCLRVEEFEALEKALDQGEEER